MKVDHSSVPTDVLERMRDQAQTDIRKWGSHYLNLQERLQVAAGRVADLRETLGGLEAELWSRKPLD